MRKAAAVLVCLLVASLALPARGQVMPDFRASPSPVYKGEILKIRGSRWYGAPPECERRVILTVLSLSGTRKADLGSTPIKSDHSLAFNWRVKGLRANQEYKVGARQPCYDSSGRPMLNATSTQFRVEKPFIEVQPNHVFLGERVRIRGLTWNTRSICRSSVRVTVRKEGQPAKSVGSAALNTKGAFSLGWKVAGFEAGRWQLKGVQSCKQAGKSFSLKATAKLRVEDLGGPEPPQEPEPEDPGEPSP